MSGVGADAHDHRVARASAGREAARTNPIGAPCADALPSATRGAKSATSKTSRALIRRSLTRWRHDGRFGATSGCWRSVPIATVHNIRIGRHLSAHGMPPCAVSSLCPLGGIQKNEVEHENVSGCDLVGNDRRHAAGVFSIGAALSSWISLLRCLRIRFLRR